MWCSPLLASSHWLKSDISCCYFRMACCLACCNISSRCGWGKTKRKLPRQLFSLPFRSRLKERIFFFNRRTETPMPSLRPPHLLPSPVSLLNLCCCRSWNWGHAHVSMHHWYDGRRVSRSVQDVLVLFRLVHLSWTESERQFEKTQQPLFHDRILNLPQRSLSRCTQKKWSADFN